MDIVDMSPEKTFLCSVSMRLHLPSELTSWLASFIGHDW